MKKKSKGLLLFDDNKSASYLVLGSSQSGKSTFIKELEKINSKSLFRSMNFDLNETKLPMFLVRRTFFTNNKYPKGILFVINSNQETIRSEKALIYDALCNLPCKDLPILFMANFQGESSSLSPVEIRQYLGLPDILNFTVIGCSGITNEGFENGFHWLIKEVRSRLPKERINICF